MTMHVPSQAEAGKLLLDAGALTRTLTRIAHEIIEGNPELDRVALVGIQTRGVPLAQRLRRLIAERAGEDVELGARTLVARWTDARVVNAGDGKHHHPRQALLGLYTLHEDFRRIAGLH